MLCVSVIGLFLSVLGRLNDSLQAALIEKGRWMVAGVPLLSAGEGRNRAMLIQSKAEAFLAVCVGRGLSATNVRWRCPGFCASGGKG